jgi:2-oxoglutarate ferredoxin oxidoreductase subunit beta
MSFAYEKYIRKGTLPHIWCAGCGHGILMKSIIRAIAQMGIDKNKIAVVSGIGCVSRMTGYLDFNTLHTTHGRAITFATGLKMVRPEMTVILVCGDGDAVAIGGNHFIHACRRNIDLTMIVANNYIYGMTGGQMAPTTILGQTTTTSPGGRRERRDGFPINLSEMVAVAKGSAYIERTAVNSPANILKTKID